MKAPACHACKLFTIIAGLQRTSSDSPCVFSNLLAPFDKNREQPGMSCKYPVCRGNAPVKEIRLHLNLCSNQRHNVLRKTMKKKLST